jgi:periplasmic protein TonB
MKETSTPEEKFSCPVLIGPGWLEFTRGISPVFLVASVVLHVVLFVVLPSASSHRGGAPRETIMVKLQADAVALPLRPVAVRQVMPQPLAQVPRPAMISAIRSKPAPQPPGKTNPSPRSQTAPPAAAAAGGTVEPGAVVGTSGDNGPAVASGTGVGAGGGSGTGPATGVPKPDGLPGGTGTGSTPAVIPPVIPPKPASPKPQPKPEPVIDVKALLAIYAGGVKASILRHKAYPAVAERLSHEGAVKVSFTIDSGGSLLSATVRSSSGFDELDQAALDAVQNAAPFDEIPQETGKSQLSLSITLKFSLGG